MRKEIGIMFKICHISTVHFVFDNRIFYKECKTLSEAGYDVYLIATHNKEESIDGVHIIPLPDKKGRFYRFFVKDWLVLVRAIKLNAKIYHIHDPELIFIGIILKILGKRIIYDVHEDVSKQILNKEWLGPYFIRKSIAVFFKFIEHTFSLCFDGIVAATEGIAKKFPKQKTVVARNFPILKLIDKTEPIKENRGNKFIIIYAGGLTRIRGIKEIVRSLSYLQGKAELWLLGKWESDSFENECKSLDSWKYVKYFGFRLPGGVYSCMKTADLGIALLYPVKNYLNSLPVKSFEYIACGIPIVMSNFPYWKKIFKDYALFANPKDPLDIAGKIKIFMDNEELRVKMGNKGKLAAQNVYSWEAESKKLLKLYKELLK